MAEGSSRTIGRRSLGSPTLFAIVYTSVASAIYFALGVVGEHALGLTPVVFLVAGLFFVVTTMTYVEGASLHQERAGSTVFARYAFNELWSFVAGWAILLDFLILVSVTSVMTTDYAAVIWDEGDAGVAGTVLIVGHGVYVSKRNILGFSSTRTRRILVLVVVDLALQLLIIVIGLIVVFDPQLLIDQVGLGTTPDWDEMLFALTLATVAFTSLESAAGLAGEVAVGRRGMKRLVTSTAVTVIVIYVGIAIVALSAPPVTDGRAELGTTHFEPPAVGGIPGVASA